MIVRRGVAPRAGWRHPGYNFPACFGVYRHRCREVVAPPFRIWKEVGPIEQDKIRTRPRVGIVETVGQIIESHRDLPDAAWANTPRIGIDLVPAQISAGFLGGKIGDVARKVVDLVGARRPLGNRKQDGLGAANRERHRRRDLALLGVGASERHIVADVRDRRGSSDALSSCVVHRTNGKYRDQQQNDFSSHWQSRKH